jgi:hypothetical protein
MQFSNECLYAYAYEREEDIYDESILEEDEDLIYN